MNGGTTLTISVNGREVSGPAVPHWSLLRWLRNSAVYDVKYGCGEGVCGTCTVLLDGVSTASCLLLAVQARGREVQTASGLAHNGELDALQRAFLETGAAQCGFCTPGMVLACTELLRSQQPLDREAVREGLKGNLCRCTGYKPIVDAVMQVAADERA